MTSIPQPSHIGFMNTRMRTFWQEHLRGPMEGNLRLYGGTALALYLDHRPSISFNFCTPDSVIDVDFVQSLEWLEGGAFNGGAGMIDVRLPETRQHDPLLITLMECGPTIPFPKFEPIIASNGVAVAHPADLISCKLEACASRAAVRDYIDIAAAIRSWPDMVMKTIQNSENRYAAAVSSVLVNPPVEVFPELTSEDIRTLRSFDAGGTAPLPPDWHRSSEPF